MDDILQRLGIVESLFGDMRTDVSALKAVSPHLATKADLSKVEHTLETQIGAVQGDIARVEGSLKTQIAQVEGSLRAEMHSLETRIIKWMVATMIASVGLAFTIAKFVN